MGGGSPKALPGMGDSSESGQLGAGSQVPEGAHLGDPFWLRDLWGQGLADRTSAEAPLPHPCWGGCP